MQIYWLQENIEQWYWVVGIVVGFLVLILLFYYWVTTNVKNDKNATVDIMGSRIPLRWFKYETIVWCCVSIYICTYIYTQFMGIIFFEQHIHLRYLKPRPSIMIDFQKLTSYQIKKSRLIFHTERGKQYLSVVIDPSLKQKTEKKIKEHMPWIQERQ